MNIAQLSNQVSAAAIHPFVRSIYTDTYLSSPRQLIVRPIPAFVEMDSNDQKDSTKSKGSAQEQGSNKEGEIKEGTMPKERETKPWEAPMSDEDAGRMGYISK
jgi:hypothetical protein